MQPVVNWFEILDGLERATNSGLLRDSETISKIQEQLRHVREALEGIPQDDLGSDASRSLIPLKTTRGVVLPALLMVFKLMRKDLQTSMEKLHGSLSSLHKAETDFKKLAAAIDRAGGR